MLRTALLISMLAACGNDSPGIASDAPATVDGAPDATPDAPPVVPRHPVHLMRTGGVYLEGGNSSVNNTLSFAPPGGVTFGAYDVPTWPATLACVKARLAPFDLGVIEFVPGDDVNHIEIVISPGNGTEVGAPAASTSRSGANCMPQVHGIGVVWPGAVGNDPDTTCELIVSTIGLLSGLEFTSACDDAMAFGFAKPACGGGFTDGARPCGFDEPAAACRCDPTVTTQNSHAKMIAVYGAAP
jgi:hypothetical protein